MKKVNKKNNPEKNAVVKEEVAEKATKGKKAAPAEKEAPKQEKAKKAKVAAKAEETAASTEAQEVIETSAVLQVSEPLYHVAADKVKVGDLNANSAMHLAAAMIDTASQITISRQ